MTKNKRIALLLFFLLVSIHPLFSQSNGFALKQWEALITRQIKYPIEAIRGRKEGVVAVSLSTDTESNLVEIMLEKKAATSDLLTYQELTEKVLTQIDIKVFQQVSTRTVTGTIRN